MSTRRKASRQLQNGDVNSSASQTANMSSSTTRSPKTSPQHSAYLPTPLESLLLAAYPATLVLGSIFSILDPASRASHYDAATQSYPPEGAPSFFARKRNPFNVLFVKAGWLWTGAALLGFLVFSLPPRTALSTLRAQAALRWALATMWWIAVTQWFFGPGLIDRGFGLTGGVCELAKEEGGKVGQKIWSSKACKIAGGRWTGGHDISGHVFILILGSGMLLFEMLPIVFSSMRGLNAERVVAGAGGQAVHVEDEELATRPTGPGAEKGEADQHKFEGLSRWATMFSFSVAGLEWLMLFMTAAYFHTWFEKFTGFLVSTTALWTIYFLPRIFAPARAVLGMPGV